MALIRGNNHIVFMNKVLVPHFIFPEKTLSGGLKATSDWAVLRSLDRSESKLHVNLHRDQQILSLEGHRMK